MNNYIPNPVGEAIKETNDQWIEDNLSALQDHFIGLNEYGGIPIVKDNCEDLFENWLEATDYSELQKIINHKSND